MKMDMLQKINKDYELVTKKWKQENQISNIDLAKAEIDVFKQMMIDKLWLIVLNISNRKSPRIKRCVPCKKHRRTSTRLRNRF